MSADARAGRITAVLAMLFAVLAPAAVAQDEDYNDDHGVIDDRPEAQVDRNLRIPPAKESAAKDIDLQHRLSEIEINDGPEGLSVRVPTEQGGRVLTPGEYLRAVQAAQETQRSNGFFYVLFNITRPWGFVWVSAGFLAQAMFTYRMILQWWASEKHKRSVVPVGYWWGSLWGGLLLFVYFVWRKDIVGYLGQVTAIFIYARNLVLIYRGRRIEAEGARTLAADEPAPGASS